MQQKNNPQRAKGIFFVLLGAGLWGASGVAAQFLFHTKLLTPEWLVVVRLLISGILFLSYDYLKNRDNLMRIFLLPYDRRQLFCFAFFGMLGVQYTYFAAIKHGNAATATILQYLMPIIVVAFIAYRGKTLPTVKEGFAVLLAVLGTFFLVTKGDFHSLVISPPALFWGISSAFAAAFYTLQPKYLLRHWRSPLVIGWGMLIGGIIMMPLNSPWEFQGIWDGETLLAIAFIIIFGTVIAFYAYLESLLHILPSETSVFASAEPLAAVILSIALLHTPFGLFDGLGGLSILCAVFILSKK